MQLTVDLTAVRPSAGGVGTFARGVLRGLSDADVAHVCLTTEASEQEWRDALAGSPLSQVRAATVRLAADSGWQRAVRRVTPGGLRRSAAVGWVRQVRARSIASSVAGTTVWQPFHRAHLTSDDGVVTVHDLRVFHPGLESPMDQRVVASNVARARAVVCSWRHPYLDLLERFPDAADKAFQVPFPVLRSGQPTPRSLRPDGAVRVLVPAFVTPHKNHETLLRSLAHLPEVHVVSTGAAEADHLLRLQALATELGVADRVEWRGHVSDDELEAAYREADLLVMPTRWEAASGPLMEAVVRGLPLVASDIPPIRAQLDELGLHVETFEWSDPRALAAAVRRTVARYDEHVTALRPAADSLRGRTWEDTARDYARVFAWAAGDGPRPDDLRPGGAP